MLEGSRCRGNEWDLIGHLLQGISPPRLDSNHHDRSPRLLVRLAFKLLLTPVDFDVDETNTAVYIWGWQCCIYMAIQCPISGFPCHGDILCVTKQKHLSPGEMETNLEE